MPDRAAFAVVHDDEPLVLLAADDAVMSRLLALRLVAATNPAEIPPGWLGPLRSALLEERWADAVVAWMEAVGRRVDVFPDEPVWSDVELTEEMAAFEIRLAPIFQD